MGEPFVVSIETGQEIASLLAVSMSLRRSPVKTSRRCVGSLSLVLLALGCVQSLYANSVYNVVTGFSGASNPNGVWTYNYNGIAFTDSQSVSNFVGAGVSGWWTREAIPNSLIIIQNVSGSTVSYLTIRDPTSTLWLDPESGNVSVMFAAPSAGTYHISGAFLGIDTGENAHPVEIMDNGVVIWTGTISSFGGKDSFNLSESLAAGGTLSFYVGTGSSGCYYCNLSTGLTGTITEGSTTTVPEPGTLNLLGSGLIVLVLMLRSLSSQASD